jgi:hypothetical protein
MTEEVARNADLSNSNKEQENQSHVYFVRSQNDDAEIPNISKEGENGEKDLSNVNKEDEHDEKNMSHVMEEGQ